MLITCFEVVGKQFFLAGQFTKFSVDILNETDGNGKVSISFVGNVPPPNFNFKGKSIFATFYSLLSRFV